MLAILKTLTLAVLATSVIARPIESRQPPSSTWKDPYIAEPTDFKVTRIKKCIYQLTFHRDVVDSRYSYDFEALYGEQAVKLEPISGGLPVSRTIEIFTTYSPTGRYQISDSEVLSVHHFNNACLDGSAPRAFRVRAILPKGQYTYKNNYRTEPIAVTSDTVPGVPANVRVRRTSDGYRVTWDGVAGATGYFALAAGTYPNSEVGDVDVIYTAITGSGGRSATFNDRTESIAVVARGADGVVSRTDKVPEIPVPAS